MTKQIPLVDKLYVLEKFQGKGGWTFARIPEVAPNNNSPFGWVRVNGTIDCCEIRNYNLQPIGNGLLFLPIKSEIRKKIKKQEGDSVHIVLYEDLNPIEIPAELILCLKEVEGVYEAFLAYSESKKITILNCIYSAKTDQTKVNRIAKTINEIVNKIK
ncbi:YdeI/OmpD-associated family protein [Sphingobacterium sp.]|uniref:YdeI/OmpD-associated family protein n=1 Tax=Sphingobacterium sp. TaxID=341027 RepID=UPI00258D9A9E|nr:YdeI/OmpD-associated family protein [Sphingobacterium sp.]WET67861.1 MAG: YdeI/OmpD-associated family protein [Sphingobacterium sp.]